MEEIFPVQIILGSKNDRTVVDESGMLDILQKLVVPWSISYISAHRHAGELLDYCREVIKNGAKVFITAAGMMPALPGVVASATKAETPVIGVVLDSPTISGKDTIATAVSMPKGTPVLFAGIGKYGLANAAIAAAQILAVDNPPLRERLLAFRAENNPEPEIGVESSKTYKSKC